MLLLVSAMVPRVFSQSTFGSIVGTVQDPSGGGVPGATITVTDLDEKTSRSTNSGNNGLYQFVNLKPGRYSVKVDKSGFAATQIPEVPTPAGAGRIGNSGVGICEGPGTVTIAAGIGKTFKVNERIKMRFNASFTNILNHPNFAPPPVDVSSPSNFGVTQTVQTSENGGNRVGQLSFRLDF